MKIFSDRWVFRELDAEEGVQALASEFDMTKIREVSAPEGKGLVRQVSWEVDPGLKMHYAVDYLSATSFVLLESDTDVPFGRLPELAQAIGEELWPWTLDELLEEVDLEVALYDDDSTDSRAVARAVIRLGVGAPNEYNEEVFNRILNAMHSAEAWIRKAAIWATTYSRWPQFRPLLSEIADTDSDQEIRSDARLMTDIDGEPENES